MFDLVAIALFQIATMFGYPTEQPTANDTTPTSTTADGGSGGWGHDIQSNTPTPPPANLDGGSGGWGHD